MSCPGFGLLRCPGSCCSCSHIRCTGNSDCIPPCLQISRRAAAAGALNASKVHRRHTFNMHTEHVAARPLHADPQCSPPSPAWGWRNRRSRKIAVASGSCMRMPVAASCSSLNPQISWASFSASRLGMCLQGRHKHSAASIDTCTRIALPLKTAELQSKATRAQAQSRQEVATSDAGLRRSGKLQESCQKVAVLESRRLPHPVPGLFNRRHKMQLSVQLAHDNSA